MRMSQVNQAIHHLGLELVRGRGYFYFLSLRTGYQVGTMVTVYRLNHLPLDRWVERAEYAVEEEQRQ